MKNSILKYLPLLFIFLFTACEFEDVMSDDELIDAIINAEEKVQILESNLPTDAKNTMSSDCLLYTSPSPRDGSISRMPSSA